MGGCGTQARAREVNVFTRRLGGATECGSRLNVELEGKEEKKNPTFLTSTTKEKVVPFEITEEKAIGEGEAF